MDKRIMVTASIFGLLGIILGAFGAHGLEKLVAQEAVETFETGVRYQMYHAFFLFVIGLLPQISLKAKKIIFISTVIGIVLFSFSIYLLALDAVLSFDVTRIGFLTPIGGLFLILGWGMLAYHFFKGSKNL